MEVDHPVAGRLRRTHTAARFAETPAQVERRAARLGEHNDEFVQEIGFSMTDIEEPRERGVLGHETYGEY